MVIRLALVGAVGALLAAAPLAATAQSKTQAHTYRCVGKDGKKYYGQTIPRACIGQPIEALSKYGTVLYRVDAEGDEKMRAQKEAEAAKKREMDALAREEARRNRALLATYTSEKDIEDARARELAENAKLVKEVEGRIAAIKKRQAGYAKEMEFYSDKGGKKGGAKPPAKLLEDIRLAEVDLKLQEQALEERKKQVGTINAKYDEDLRRFRALTKR